MHETADNTASPAPLLAAMPRSTPEQGSPLEPAPAQTQILHPAQYHSLSPCSGSSTHRRVAGNKPQDWQKYAISLSKCCLGFPAHSLHLGSKGERAQQEAVADRETET